MKERITKKTYTEEKSIYWDLEAPFLYDYVNFANKLRPLQVLTSQHEEYAMEQDGKRLHLILLIELYQKSLEDLGAILMGFYRRFNQENSCGYQKNFKQTETPLVYTLINYGVGEAAIKNTTDKLPSQKEFIKGLHINDIGQLNVNLFLPDLDILGFYNDVYKNIIAWRDDQEKRFKMYNKIKHGPIVIGSAKMINSQNKNAPAVIYRDKDADLKDHPLIVYTLHFTESEFLLLQNGVVKVSQCIRDLIAIYLCKNYPDFLKEQGFSSPLLFFKHGRPEKRKDD